MYFMHDTLFVCMSLYVNLKYARIYLLEVYEVVKVF